jgi:GTPase SAR1 family protein
MLDIDENDEIIIKTILIGNSGVGKTNLINTSIGEEFNEKENCTTGGSFVQKKITINNKNYYKKLRISYFIAFNYFFINK